MYNSITLFVFTTVFIVALGVFNKATKNTLKNAASSSFRRKLTYAPSEANSLAMDSADIAVDGSAEQGLALYRQGKETGDSAVLRQAVAALRQQLDVLPRQQMPMEWAKNQNDLGNALRTLGEVELNVEHLQAAIRSYRAALQEFTRERYPSQWARVHNNLGHTFHSLSGFESGTVYLKEAVKAYRAALEEFPHWRGPLNWAKTQSGLGSALAVLGRREASAVCLEEAAEVFRKALDVFESSETAGVTHHIGTALHNLEQIEDYLRHLRPKQ